MKPLYSLTAFLILALGCFLSGDKLSAQGFEFNRSGNRALPLVPKLSPIAAFPGKVFIGNVQAQEKKGYSWLTRDIGAGFMERSSSLLVINPSGGVGSTFATRASDSYVADGARGWRAGEAIGRGDQRGYNTRIYKAENEGVTAWPPPTHQAGTVLGGGSIYWTWLSNTGRQSAALMGFLLNDLPADQAGRGMMYGEAVREAGAGTTLGAEINVKNKGSNVIATPLKPFGGGGATIGWYLAAGGDSAYGGASANPSTAALLIGQNRNSWNTGILIRDGSLTRDQGGHGEAIALPYKAGINFYRGMQNEVGSTIRGEGNNSGQGVLLQMGDNEVSVSQRESGLPYLIVRAPSSGVANGIKIIGSEPGISPEIIPFGSDAALDLRLHAKGEASVVIDAPLTKTRATVDGSKVRLEAAGEPLLVPKATSWLALVQTTVIDNQAIVLPEPYGDGHILRISTIGPISQIEMRGINGAKVQGVPHSLPANSSVQFGWDAPGRQWLRLQ